MPLALGQAGTPESLVVSSGSRDLADSLAYNNVGVPASGPLGGAGIAQFMPFRLSQRRTYLRAWWLNGAVAAGTTDLGVYTISGTTATRVQSIGPTTQAGVSAMQTVTVSWTFDPGLYYLVLAPSDVATSTYFRVSANIAAVRQMGAYQASAQSTLGATVTVVLLAVGQFPLFGLAEQAVI